MKLKICLNKILFNFNHPAWILTTYIALQLAFTWLQVCILEAQTIVANRGGCLGMEFFLFFCSFLAMTQSCQMLPQTGLHKQWKNYEKCRFFPPNRNNKNFYTLWVT